MKKHWELDLWKAFFGRLCIIFTLSHLYLTWRVMGEKDFWQVYLICTLLIFLPAYLLSLYAWIQAKHHEKERKWDNLVLKTYKEKLCSTKSLSKSDHIKKKCHLRLEYVTA